MSDHWVWTISGIKFDYVDLHPDMLCLADIIHAIAREKRFANHTQIPVSVLEHSLNVSGIMQGVIAVNAPDDQEYPPKTSGHIAKELGLIGLLHDASEAYTRDIPRPMKELCPGFKVIEARIADAVYEKFLGRLPTKLELEVLKIADDVALVDEMKRFIPTFYTTPTELDALPFSVKDWRPLVFGLSDEEAELKFTKMYFNLKGL